MELTEYKNSYNFITAAGTTGSFPIIGLPKHMGTVQKTITGVNGSTFEVFYLSISTY